MSISIDILLQHILEEIDFLQKKRSGIDEEAFLQNDTLKRAFVRSLEIIGEASKNIDPIIKESNPHVPWKKLAGLRDKLIHGYFGVDYPLVWDVITKKIDSLQTDIEEIKARQTILTPATDDQPTRN